MLNCWGYGCCTHEELYFLTPNMNRELQLDVFYIHCRNILKFKKSLRLCFRSLCVPCFNNLLWKYSQRIIIFSSPQYFTYSSIQCLLHADHKVHNSVALKCIISQGHLLFLLGENKELHPWGFFLATGWRWFCRDCRGGWQDVLCPLSTSLSGSRGWWISLSMSLTNDADSIWGRPLKYNP